MAEKAPRVVAELGRPETAAETAARKAENSRRHRDSRTTRNVVAALLASLVIVLVVVLAVPRSNTPITPEVDVVAVSEQASAATGESLAVPELDGWTANAAELRSSKAEGVTAWYTGWITPGKEFIGSYQAFDANPSWVAGILQKTAATGTSEIDGVTWTVYDHRDSGDDLGNARYGMVAETPGADYVLLGTADPAEFAEFAEALAPSIRAE
ncbi:DUF4245 family protein [Agromyces archimandritae]|uniref:DUF4245 domain-containing protein n=1 Tax=Agromyces archimandritae TaxID=2781962 RepID=A0A975FLN9_9MICO|nr:DUF4245 family protein [Agromyces archimandritae]QTX04181.1 DUF4245 domain-containing protein [Agromyces archimandritae]